MGLEDNDLLRDDGIDRGIGTSPLLSQRIQRNNIEQTRRLSAAIAESQATLENEREQRLAQARKEFSQSLASAHQVRGGRDGGAGSAPARYLLEVTDGYRTVLNSSPEQLAAGAGTGFFGAGNSPRFRIRGAKVDGGQEYKQFSSADELLGYLNDNPEIRDTLVGLAGDPLEKALGDKADRLAINRIGAIEAKSLIGGTTRGRGTPFRNARIPEAQQAIQDKELAKFGTNKSGDIDFTKIDRNTQARMFDSELQRYNAIAKTVPVLGSVEDFNNLSPSQQIAVAISGAPNLSEKFKAFQSAAKSGLVKVRK